MARKIRETENKRTRRPALNPESREQQLVALAIDLAEKQLAEGTASSQVITHYLKLGTRNHQLELEKLEKENELLRAKTEALQSSARMEELYINALSAMKNYKGDRSDDDFEE